MPKVSVIIPIYGVEKYIECCARSLFEQTLDDIEYLFIDDSTPDKSIEVLKKVLVDYPQRIPQVIIHRMQHNSGQAAVRKWGIINATGDYIIHCDGDDWLDKDMYKKMYNIAVANNADIVRCYFSRVSSTVTSCTLLPNDIYNDNVKIIKKMFVGNDLSSLCDKLVSKQLYNLLSVFPTENMWEDVLICTQLFYNSKKVVCLPEYLYYYRIHESSIVNTPSIESARRRLYQSKNNVYKIEEFLHKMCCEKEFEDAVDCMKRRVKNQLLPYINSSSVFSEWKSIYSEINFRILLNPLLSFKGKISHLMALARLYPIFSFVLD